MYPPLGRPREFKCKMRDELVNHVACGATVAEAAQIVGVSLRTVQREARHNQHFHHDLELAKFSAPTDLEQQMQQAARTHWRAAAWLLERKDPDRYAKRPANSCSPAMLQDACDFLIEKALEATPPEHREAVYRHITTAADQMYEVIMPDRSVERRCLASALSKQTTPLSCELESKLLEDPDYARQQRRNQDLARRPWRQVERLLGAKRSEETVEGRPTSRWQPSNGKRLDSEDMDAAWRYPTPEEEDAYADKLDEQRGYTKQRVAELVQSRARWAEELDRKQKEKEKKNPLVHNGDARASAERTEATPTAPPSACAPSASCTSDGSSETNGECHAAPEGACEGIMSPKTCFRDKTQATKCEATKSSAAEPAEGVNDASETSPTATNGSPSGADATNSQREHRFQTLLDQFRKRPPNGNAA